MEKNFKRKSFGIFLHSPKKNHIITTKYMKSDEIGDSQPFQCTSFKFIKVDIF